MAPPDSMTSLCAMMRWVLPLCLYSTPIARSPSNKMRCAKAWVNRVKFERPKAGRKYATAALQRRPLRLVLSRRATPSGLYPLGSSVWPWPACCPASRKTSSSGFFRLARDTESGPSAPCHSLSPRSLDSLRRKYGRHWSKLH